MKIHKADPSQVFLKPLQDIANSPKTLWFRGQLPEYRGVGAVAIVGSRKSTKYGETIAYKISKDLASQGVIIVSGMAYGVDAAAHRGCIAAGGITVAVLGTAIDQIYPRQNQSLAEKILERGAIISEYGVNDNTGNWSFLARNRIVSGLSNILVITEAAAKSGTMSTAAFALDQGKIVFAVPGDITRPMSKGCNNLIKQGAIPFCDSQDLLSLLFPNRKPPSYSKIFTDNAIENSIISQLQAGISDGEEIIAKSKLTVSEFNQAITMLEIKGLIVSLGFNKWQIL